MASVFAMRWFAILALLVVCFEMSARPIVVKAEDVEVSDAAADEGKAADAPAEGAAAEEGDEEKGQQFVDSAKELQEKLAQLKELIDARGDGVDPDLKAKLSGLEAQLGSLGLDSLTGGSGSNKDLTEFYGACVVLTMKRAGMHAPSTLSALRRLSNDNLPPAEAAKNDFWRMVVECMTELKEDEYADFKKGKMAKLPKAYETASKKPENEKKVLEVEAQAWEELKTIASGLMKELSGGGNQAAPPMNAGYLAAIPILIAAGFLGKMFMGVQKEKEEKSSKKASKKKSS